MLSSFGVGKPAQIKPPSQVYDMELCPPVVSIRSALHPWCKVVPGWYTRLVNLSGADLVYLSGTRSGGFLKELVILQSPSAMTCPPCACRTPHACGYRYYRIHIRTQSLRAQPGASCQSKMHGHATSLANTKHLQSFL